MEGRAESSTHPRVWLANRMPQRGVSRLLPQHQPQNLLDTPTTAASQCLKWCQELYHLTSGDLAPCFDHRASPCSSLEREPWMNREGTPWGNSDCWKTRDKLLEFICQTPPVEPDFPAADGGGTLEVSTFMPDGEEWFERAAFTEERSLWFTCMASFHFLAINKLENKSDMVKFRHCSGGRSWDRLPTSHCSPLWRQKERKWHLDFLHDCCNHVVSPLLDQITMNPWDKTLKQTLFSFKFLLRTVVCFLPWKKKT